MNLNSETLLILGPVGILFFFAIKEFFTYLKQKKSTEANPSIMSEQIFQELQTMNNNHLHSIQDAIQDGNNRLIDTINHGNNKMIEVLGRIEGRIQR